MCSSQDTKKDPKSTQKRTDNGSPQNLIFNAYILILGCWFHTRYYCHGICDITKEITKAKKSMEKRAKYKNAPKWIRFCIHILFWVPVSANMFPKFSIFRTMKRLKGPEMHPKVDLKIKILWIWRNMYLNIFFLFLTGTFSLSPKSTDSHSLTGSTSWSQWNLWKVSQLSVNYLFKILPFLSQIS